MEKKPRRQYSPEEKVRILRLHLLEGKAVSEICELEGIHPTLFYQWQRTFFENGLAAFSSPRTETKSSAAEKKIETLESKLKRKDEVIAEIMEDFIRANSTIGVTATAGPPNTTPSFHVITALRRTSANSSSTLPASTHSKAIVA